MQDCNCKYNDYMISRGNYNYVNRQYDYLLGHDDTIYKQVD